VVGAGAPPGGQEGVLQRLLGQLPEEVLVASRPASQGAWRRYNSSRARRSLAATAATSWSSPDAAVATRSVAVPAASMAARAANIMAGP
jgi:hypothetical protein